MDKLWYQISNLHEVPSPAVVVYPERIKENIRRLITLAGGPARLRPHIKTHKMCEIILLHLEAGIQKFKCATIAEAEMAGQAGASDILIAYQPVGPNIHRLLDLTRTYPAARFSTVVDHADVIAQLSQFFSRESKPLPVYLDLDCGMGRTGIAPGAKAFDLYRQLVLSAGLEPAGLHAYDGHIHTTDSTEREKLTLEGFTPVLEFRQTLQNSGLPVPNLVAGGTPTFPIHARFPDRECSPGTYVFWDFGYQEKFPDLDFLLAALLITRVISKPSPTRLSLDLGYKAVASESPPPRVRFLNLPEANAVMHSEEHLVVETPEPNNLQIGDVLFGVPRHICPTVALHDRAVVIRKSFAAERWPIRARNRSISI